MKNASPPGTPVQLTQRLDLSLVEARAARCQVGVNCSVQFLG